MITLKEFSSKKLRSTELYSINGGKSKKTSYKDPGGEWKKGDVYDVTNKQTVFPNENWSPADENL